MVTLIIFAAKYLFAVIALGMLGVGAGLRRERRRPQVTATGARDFWGLPWGTGRPYLILGIESLLTALLITAGMANTGTQVTT